MLKGKSATFPDQLEQKINYSCLGQIDSFAPFFEPLPLLWFAHNDEQKTRTHTHKRGAL